MFAAMLKAAPPESSGDPQPTDGGDEESLDTARAQPLADDAPAGSQGTAGNDDAGPARHRRTRRTRILAYGVLPTAALLLAGTAGYLKWVDGTARDAEVASVQSVHAAVDSTVAMLSYKPDTVEQNLSAARDRMTGAFRDSYTSLTHDVVIPGAKQRQISAVATVPAAASVTATATHAVVLVFVNQTTVVGNDPPSDTASTVKVTLEMLGDRWLISQFDPV
jgi:Mce-associated membrane protein